MFENFIMGAITLFGAVWGGKSFYQWAHSRGYNKNDVDMRPGKWEYEGLKDRVKSLETNKK